MSCPFQEGDSDRSNLKTVPIPAHVPHMSMPEGCVCVGGGTLPPARGAWRADVVCDAWPGAAQTWVDPSAWGPLLRPRVGGALAGGGAEPLFAGGASPPHPRAGEAGRRGAPFLRPPFAHCGSHVSNPPPVARFVPQDFPGSATSPGPPRLSNSRRARARTLPLRAPNAHPGGSEPVGCRAGGPQRPVREEPNWRKGGEGERGALPRQREQQIAPSQWQRRDEVAPNSLRPMTRQNLRNH